MEVQVLSSAPRLKNSKNGFIIYFVEPFFLYKFYLGPVLLMMLERLASCGEEGIRGSVTVVPLLESDRQL